MLCVSSLAMDEFHTCFYDAADSNPEAFSPFGRMEKCAQLMLLVAVLLRAVRTWKTHAADSLIVGGFFAAQCGIFSASSLELRPCQLMTMVLWTYTYS